MRRKPSNDGGKLRSGIGRSCSSSQNGSISRVYPALTVAKVAAVIQCRSRARRDMRATAAGAGAVGEEDWEGAFTRRISAGDQVIKTGLKNPGRRGYAM